jgi:hypothetical protein
MHNTNQKTIKVKSGVRAGLGGYNHNATRGGGRALVIRSTIRAGVATSNHSQTLRVSPRGCRVA